MLLSMSEVPFPPYTALTIIHIHSLGLDLNHFILQYCYLLKKLFDHQMIKICFSYIFGLSPGFLAHSAPKALGIS